MLNIEEVLASAGVSAGIYSAYKIGVRLYQKYYIQSDCRHPSDKTNEIVITITELEPAHDQPHEAPKEEQKEAH